MRPSTTTKTTTDHWYLDKYSRSRPPPSSEGPPTKRARTGAEGAAGGGGGDNVLEWDHYTQPQLHLYLSSSSFPSSPPQIKLSITFEPTNQSTHSTHQRLELESLSLTSFSSPAILAQTPLDQLPLKAVFRNTVIGVRYISLGGQGGHEFKRFQAKFANKDEMERFVRAIEGVCPIKPAEEKRGTTGLRRTATSGIAPVAPGSATSTTTNLPSSSNATRPPPTSSPDDQPLPPAPTTLPARISTLFPKLAQSLLPPPPQPSKTIPHEATCEELANLEREAFEGLLEEVLCEEGFGKLVERVQEALRG